MSIIAFKRMREQNEAVEKAASLVQTLEKPKPKSNPKKVKLDGDIT